MSDDPIDAAIQKLVQEEEQLDAALLKHKLGVRDTQAKLGQVRKAIRALSKMRAVNEDPGDAFRCRVCSNQALSKQAHSRHLNKTRHRDEHERLLREEAG